MVDDESTTSIVLADRISYVVYIDEKQKFNLLQVAIKLNKLGFNIETILNNRPCIFGSLSSQDDPEKIFRSLTEVTSWIKG